MSQADIYTVSRLNSEVRLTLELQFRQLWLVGEVSNFVAASSGHWYFSLKDQAAQVKVAMFKTSNRNAVFTPRNGQQVMVRARISVYEPRGEYQLLADFIEPAGDGLLRQQYEQLKAKLAAEGLFAPERKKPLPASVQTVGVITSPTGAAIRDILTVLQRRAPALSVIIYPSLVQGSQAAADLTAALQHAIQRQECQVLIIGRGGGSLEDLWCFNDETLARTIANCPIPIVSAVGHEIDFSISDFVADVRAATPSAAAELVSPDQQHQLQQLQQQQQRLLQAIRQRLASASQQLLHQSSRLQLLHPARRVQQQQQRLDELQIRLHQAMQQQLQQKKQQWQLQQTALSLVSPQQQLQRQQQQLQMLSQQLLRSWQQQLQRRQQQWQLLSSQLHTVSPLATLERGYSIVFSAEDDAINQNPTVTQGVPTGVVVKSQQQLKLGQRVHIRLADGEFDARVEAITPSNRTS
jgi:exodeoxyribonuclease VII large subunit